MKVNLGCGPDWDAPDGWVGADLVDYGQRFVLDLAHPETWPADFTGLTVSTMHHVLHMLTTDEARAAMRELAHRTLAGGILRIEERDLWAGIRAWESRGGKWLAQVVADEVEPTMDGKLLRWLTWHGTVRSLWSHDSLVEALRTAGWAEATPCSWLTSRLDDVGRMDTRPVESLYVEASR